MLLIESRINEGVASLLWWNVRGGGAGWKWFTLGTGNKGL